MRAVYKYWAALVFLAVIVQVGLAGYGAFFVANAVDESPVNEDKFEDGFGLHAGIGYLVVLLGLIFLVIALAARIGKPRIWRNVWLAGLLVLQVLLAWFGFGVPAIGALHPINALAIFALSGSIAWAAWREPAQEPAGEIAVELG